MAKNVFSKKEVGDFFNKNFISVKVQCDKNVEGEKIAKKYKVNAFPTLMWVKPDGTVVHKAMGMKSKEKLIQEGKTALKKYKKLEEPEEEPAMPGGG